VKEKQRTGMCEGKKKKGLLVKNGGCGGGHLRQSAQGIMFRVKAA